MPPGWEQLLNYGVLGILAVAVLWFLYHTIQYLFSRDDKKPGYVSQLIETHMENQRAQKQLYQALVQREGEQQLLCNKHATLLEEHNVCAHEMCGNVDKLKAAAREACNLARTISRNEWPQSVDAVEHHCREIERIVDEA